MSNINFHSSFSAVGYIQCDDSIRFSNRGTDYSLTFTIKTPRPKSIYTNKIVYDVMNCQIWNEHSDSMLSWFKQGLIKNGSVVEVKGEIKNSNPPKSSVVVFIRSIEDISILEV